MAETPNPIETLTELARDAFYVTVGAGVIAFQKLQVQRNDFQKAFEGQLGEAKESFDAISKQVEAQFKDVEKRITEVEARIEKALADLEDRLPEQARDLVSEARKVLNRAA